MLEASDPGGDEDAGRPSGPIRGPRTRLSFSDLPAELQRMVWRHAINSLRLPSNVYRFRIDLHRRRGLSGNLQGLFPSESNYIASMTPVNEVKTILRDFFGLIKACKISRRAQGEVQLAMLDSSLRLLSFRHVGAGGRVLLAAIPFDSNNGCLCIMNVLEAMIAIDSSLLRDLTLSGMAPWERGNAALDAVEATAGLEFAAGIQHLTLAIPWNLGDAEFYLAKYGSITFAARFRNLRDCAFIRQEAVSSQACTLLGPSALTKLIAVCRHPLVQIRHVPGFPHLGISSRLARVGSFDRAWDNNISIWWYQRPVLFQRAGIEYGEAERRMFREFGPPGHRIRT